MADYNFDVFVIGSGSAGQRVANGLAKEGLSIGMIENREFGGVCALRGCDPKKVLLQFSNLSEKAKRLKGLGLTQLPAFSWEDMQTFKNTFTEKVPSRTKDKLLENGVEIFKGNGKFTDQLTFEFDDTKITAKHFVLANGLSPVKLDIPGEEHTLTSDQFLNLAHLPKKMIFIGAGYIGMEFAHLALNMGCEVIVVDKGERSLSQFDEEQVLALQSFDKEKGIEFIFEADTQEIEQDGTGFKLTYQKDKETKSVRGDLIFNVAGRKPNIEMLNPKAANIEHGKKGVKVNKYQQSISNPNIWAAGDIADSNLPLTPLSSREAKVVVQNILEAESATNEFGEIPSVVFTTPQLAQVGMSEKEALENLDQFEIKTKDKSDTYEANKENADLFHVKWILEKQTGKIKGCHIVSPVAAEQINAATTGLSAGMTLKQLQNIILAYPTWAASIM